MSWTRIFQVASKTYARHLKAGKVAVEAGPDLGFFGPSSAGKTSTIRMLMDVSQPTAGQVYLLGAPVRNTLKALWRVGAIVRGPAFYDFPASDHEKSLCWQNSTGASFSRATSSLYWRINC